MGWSSRDVGEKSRGLTGGLSSSGRRPVEVGVCTGPGCPPEARRVRCAGSRDQTRLCLSFCVGTSVRRAVK